MSTARLFAQALYQLVTGTGVSAVPQEEDWPERDLCGSEINFNKLRSILVRGRPNWNSTRNPIESQVF